MSKEDQVGIPAGEIVNKVEQVVVGSLKARQADFFQQAAQAARQQDLTGMTTLGMEINNLQAIEPKITEAFAQLVRVLEEHGLSHLLVSLVTAEVNQSEETKTPVIIQPKTAERQPVALETSTYLTYQPDAKAIVLSHMLKLAEGKPGFFSSVAPLILLPEDRENPKALKRARENVRAYKKAILRSFTDLAEEKIYLVSEAIPVLAAKEESQAMLSAYQVLKEKYGSLSIKALKELFDLSGKSTKAQKPQGHLVAKKETEPLVLSDEDKKIFEIQAFLCLNKIQDSSEICEQLGIDISQLAVEAGIIKGTENLFEFLDLSRRMAAAERDNQEIKGDKVEKQFKDFVLEILKGQEVELNEFDLKNRINLQLLVFVIKTLRKTGKAQSVLEVFFPEQTHVLDSDSRLVS